MHRNGSTDRRDSRFQSDLPRRRADGSAESPVRYQVTFARTWSAETHPQDFPLLAHFSPVIGATHNGGFEIFPRRQGGDRRSRAALRGGQAPAARRRDPRRRSRRAPRAR